MVISRQATPFPSRLCLYLVICAPIAMIPAPTLDNAWFFYLRYEIHESVGDSQQGNSISYRINVMNAHVRKLIDWCIPPSAYPIAYHMETWAPCGYAQLNSHILRYNAFVTIIIQETFSTLLNFTNFVMDDSGSQCFSSRLLIGQWSFGGRFVYPEERTYCGQQRPWFVIIDSSIVRLRFIQKNVRKPSHILFIYSAISGRPAEILRMNSYIDKTELLGSNASTLYYFPVAKSSTKEVIHRWMLIVDFGYIIKFLSLETCCFFGLIEIFDGFEELNKLINIDKENNIFLNRSIFLETTYYKSLIKLHIDEYNTSLKSRALVVLTLIPIEHQTQLLSTNSNVTINHQGLIMYKIFRFNTNSSIFPNVSFAIRKFKGINEGGCNFGGFAIKHLVNHKLFNPALLGPYCTDAASNIPLIDGIPYLVFGVHETYLIIYAYGPYYEIDINVVVQATECEGIVEPVMTCQFNFRILQTGYYQNSQVRGRNYLAKCLQIKMKYILIDILAGCVIIQSIKLSIMQSYSLDLKGNMELYVHYQKPKVRKDIGLYNNIIDAEFIIGLTNLVTSVTIPNVSMIIWKESISYLRIWQNVFNVYDYPSYALRLNTQPRTFECAEVFEDAYVHLKKYREIMLMLTITTLCGLGIYRKPAVYIYKYMIPLINKDGEYKQNMYMIITAKRCPADSNEPLDVITIILRDILFHSLDVIGDRTLYYETVDMTANLLFEKASLCSTFQLQYRVEEVRELIHEMLSLKIDVEPVNLHHMSVSD